jgi:hypothetical protein
MPSHPPWCVPARCTVGVARTGEDVQREVHRSTPTEVDGVSIWAEQAPDGEPMVAVGRFRWPLEEALLVAEAIQRVAGLAGGAPR